LPGGLSPQPDDVRDGPRREDFEATAPRRNPPPPEATPGAIDEERSDVADLIGIGYPDETIHGSAALQPVGV
jgi:hypothetical protein